MTHKILTQAFARLVWRGGLVACIGTVTVLGQTTLTLSPVNDAYVNDSAPDDTFNNAWLVAGRSPAEFTPRYRSFLRFDLGGIPSNAAVSSAVLRLNLQTLEGTTAAPIELRRVTAGWSSATLTWNTQPAATAPIVTTTVGFSIGTEYVWPIPALVQAWVSGGYSNDGLTLRTANEATVLTTRTFASANHSTAAIRPRLVVTYAVPPDITVAPTSLAFGNQPVGTSSTAQTVTVQNHGGSALTVSNMVSSSAEFIVAFTGGLPATVGTNSSLTFQVRFAPTSPGLKNATVTIASNDPDEPTRTVSCSGTGTAPDITVVPGSLSFGNQLLNMISAPQTVTVSNAGNAPLTVQAVSSGSAEFSLSGLPSLPAILHPGASFSFQVRFTPATLGARGATVSIPSSDPDEPGREVTCTGTGVGPRLVVTPTAVSFGAVTLGTTARRPLVLRNLGNSNLVITVISSTPPVFVLGNVPSLPLTLAPGQMHALSVEYTPGAVQSEAGSVRVDSNDPFTPGVVIVVNGNGALPIGMACGQAPVEGVVPVIVSPADDSTHVLGAPITFQAISDPNAPTICHFDCYSLCWYFRKVPDQAWADVAGYQFTTGRLLGCDQAMPLPGDYEVRVSMCGVTSAPIAFHVVLNPGITDASQLHPLFADPNEDEYRCHLDWTDPLNPDRLSTAHFNVIWTTNGYADDDPCDAPSGGYVTNRPSDLRLGLLECAWATFDHWLIAPLDDAALFRTLPEYSALTNVTWWIGGPGGGGVSQPMGIGYGQVVRRPAHAWVPVHELFHIFDYAGNPLHNKGRFDYRSQGNPYVFFHEAPTRLVQTLATNAFAVWGYPSEQWPVWTPLDIGLIELGYDAGVFWSYLLNSYPFAPRLSWEGPPICACAQSAEPDRLPHNLELFELWYSRVRERIRAELRPDQPLTDYGCPNQHRPPGGDESFIYNGHTHPACYQTLEYELAVLEEILRERFPFLGTPLAESLLVDFAVKFAEAFPPRRLTNGMPRAVACANLAGLFFSQGFADEGWADALVCDGVAGFNTNDFYGRIQFRVRDASLQFLRLTANDDATLYVDGRAVIEGPGDPYPDASTTYADQRADGNAGLSYVFAGTARPTSSVVEVTDPTQRHFEIEWVNRGDGKGNHDQDASGNGLSRYFLTLEGRGGGLDPLLTPIPAEHIEIVSAEFWPNQGSGAPGFARAPDPNSPIAASKEIQLRPVSSGVRPFFLPPLAVNYHPIGSPTGYACSFNVTVRHDRLTHTRPSAHLLVLTPDGVQWRGPLEQVDDDTQAVRLQSRADGGPATYEGHPAVILVVARRTLHGETNGPAQYGTLGAIHYTVSISQPPVSAEPDRYDDPNQFGNPDNNSFVQATPLPNVASGDLFTGPGPGPDRIWEMLVPDLSLHDAADRDFFRLDLPDEAGDDCLDVLPECGHGARVGNGILEITLRGACGEIIAYDALGNELARDDTYLRVGCPRESGLDPFYFAVQSSGGGEMSYFLTIAYSVPDAGLWERFGDRCIPAPRSGGGFDMDDFHKLINPLKAGWNEFIFGIDCNPIVCQPPKHDYLFFHWDGGQPLDLGFQHATGLDFAFALLDGQFQVIATAARIGSQARDAAPWVTQRLVLTYLPTGYYALRVTASQFGVPYWMRFMGQPGTGLVESVVPWSLAGTGSVFFHPFNVTTPGTLRVEVSWAEGSRPLSVALFGRRRAGASDLNAAYATVAGPSPLALTYDVTEEDLRRGAAWRLVVRDAVGAGPVSGTVRVILPFDPAQALVFGRERLRLRGGDLWPGVSLQDRFLADLAATPGEGLHAFISLNRALTCDEADQLVRLGLIRQHHLAKPGWHSYGFVRKGINLADPLLRAVLRRLTPLEPEDRVNPHILVGDYARFQVLTDGETPGHAVLNPDGTLELTVLFALDVAEARMRAILGAEVLAFEPITDQAWRTTVNPARLLSLAAYDEVEWIDPGPAPQMPDNNLTRAALNVDAIQNVTALNAGPPPVITYGGLTGLGITAGVQDTGVDATHPDLNIVATIAPAAVRAHGTHVAGILAGSGVQSSQNDAAGSPNNGTPFQWRGMAPQAALISSGDLDNAANLLAAIQNNSLDLLNRSQSISYDGAYDAENQRVDAFVQGGGVSGNVRIPRRPHVYSAGNHGAAPQNQQPANPAPPGAGGPAVGTTQLFNGGQVGYFSITKQMKNPIIVGNWDANIDGAGNDNGLSPGSSLGPAYDGRIKPDVVAPGSALASTGTGPTASGYRFSSGTSMAAPAVSGVVALLLQGWQNTYSGPLGTTIDTNPPMPSTLRALLIQTATDIVQNNVRGQASPDIDADSVSANGNDGLGNATATPGPDFTTGWGLVNAQAALDLVQDFRTEYGRPVPNRILQDAVNQGGIREYDFVVDQAGPLRVTLAWDDVEGAVQNPATAPMLVNDLDLELVAPNGTVYYPWQLGQSILDAAGNPLADDAQPPGTDLQAQVPITPINNPTYTWVVANCGVGCTQWSPTGAGTGPGNVDYVPRDAIDNDGNNDVWVARTGKDHLNNVEQVFVPNVPADQIGHWKVRVIGFDVREGAQDFSVVGFPYPDLPELVASCSDKVGLPAFDTALEFTWTAANTGPVGTGGEFNYQVWLSRDFYVNAGDVPLADANQALLGPLAAGASTEQTSSVQISQAQADDLLGNAPGTTTLDQLVSADVFLLVQVDSGEAILEHHEVNVASVQLARLVDVVLVMDRSGSMGGEVPVSSGNRTKMSILQDSANLFLDLMRLDTGDELAEVSFSDDVTTDFGPEGTRVALTSDNVDEAKAAVNALEPDTRTNIRDALQRGLDVLTANASASHRRVLIFLSDGMRTAGGDPTEAGFLGQFADAGVTVYSVGFGTEGGTGYAGLDVPLLQALANANPSEQGFFHVTESAMALDKFFVNAVAGAIRSEVVVDPEGDLRAGQHATVDVFLNSQDSIATFILTWDTPTATLDLSVVSPSGLEIHAGNAGLFADRVTTVNRPTHKLMTLRLPLVDGPSLLHGGRWRMRIRNPGEATVHYAASALAESSLRAASPQPQPGAGVFQPGTPVPLQVAVRGLGNTPVTGARVTVTPNVPLVSLGTLLAAAGITPAELALVPLERNGETLSDQERLYLALQNRLGGGNLLLRADGPPFELMAGQAAGDYAGHFTETVLDGAYTFVTRIEGRTLNCEPFQRESTRSVSVVPAPDPEHPRVEVGGGDEPGEVVVTVTPVAPGGQYLGPGLASLVTVRPGPRLAPTSDLEDNLDGSYSQHFRVVQPGQTAISVAVGGVTLPTVLADVGLPAPTAVVPSGGRNDVVTSIEVSFPPRADLAQATGLSLRDDQTAIPLEGVTINPGRSNATAQVPAGLTPGLYSVVLESAHGQGPTSPGGTFRVVGRGQDFPDGVQTIASRVRAVENAPTPAAALAQLGLALRELRDLEPGTVLTEAIRLAAFTQITGLLREGQVNSNQIGALRSAVNAAQIEARSVSLGLIPTPVGQPVRLGLGNGVAVSFGSVLSPGHTTARLVQGPPEIPPAQRGQPHVAYEVTTTASFESGAGVAVQIEYEAGDFADESLLRVLHLEEGRWVDRTVRLDTAANQIVARVASLSPFVIVQQGTVPGAVLRGIGLGVTGGFTLELEGPPGTYEIQQSSDLKTWTWATTLTLTSSPETFLDATASRNGIRFYRAIRLP